MKLKKRYTIPKLCDYNGDLSKSWFVYFRYETNGIRKLFRYKMGINRYNTKRERLDEGGIIIASLIERLESGWNPATKKVESQINITISDAFDEILEIKKAYITKESFRTYNNQVSLFKKWLVKNELDKIFTQNITSDDVRKYCDYLLKVRKYSGKTYNGHLTFLRTFFNEIVERKYMSVSPVDGFKMVRQETGKNTTYSKEEEKRFEVIKKENPNFYLATRFIKYCFIRRIELIKMQVKHINWNNKTIVIPSENGKSRFQDSVTIPKTLENMIEKSGLLELDPETYLFTKDFKPSVIKLNRGDDLTDYQREVNNRLEIKKECTFYSWKHTGVVELYNLTKDPYIVMRQCRHTDIKMTMIYLRSLGCGVNEQVRAW